MRYALAGAVLTGVLLLASAAEAQNTTRPFCIRDGVSGRGMWDCSYYTWQQCLASASGAGGTCWQNPNFQGPKRKRRPARSQRGRY